MEEMDFKDQVDGDRAEDSSGNSKDGQTTEEDLAGTAKEEALTTDSKSALLSDSKFIYCAESLDEDIFNVCKELFTPFQMSLRNLHLPQEVPTEEKVRYMKKILISLGDHIEQFLQHHCRGSEDNCWRKILWKYISLFSEMDAKQLQELYGYSKDNDMDKFLELYFSRVETDPFLQLWGLCRDTSNLQEHSGQEMVTTDTGAKSLPSKNKFKWSIREFMEELHKLGFGS